MMFLYDLISPNRATVKGFLILVDAGLSRQAYVSPAAFVKRRFSMVLGKLLGRRPGVIFHDAHLIV